MSAQNVERLRAMFETFNSEGYEPASEHIAPQAVWHTFPAWPGASQYVGRKGVGQLVSEWTENFDEYEWELEKLVERATR